MYKDFWKGSEQIHKGNWQKIKGLRVQNKYAVLLCYKVYIAG